MNRLSRMLDALLAVELVAFLSIGIVSARAPGRVLDHFVLAVAIAGALVCLALYRAR